MPDINHTKVAKAVEDKINGENILAKRALLVNVQIHCWGATKVDRKATAEVKLAHDACHDAGVFTKQLLAKETVERAQQIARACRKAHESLTLPWGGSKAGYRLCPTEGFERWAEMVNKHKAEYFEAVEKFFAEYERAVDERSRELNGLFNPDEYPTVEELRERYSFEREVMPVPTSKNFFAEVVADEADAIREALEEKNGTMLTTATDEIFRRLHDRVSSLADALDGFEIKKVIKSRKRNGRTIQTEIEEPTRRLYDSMVDHLRDLVDVLPSLNLTGDARIQGFIDEVEDKLTKFDVDDFKQNTPQAEKVRVDVQKDAADIADRLSGFFGPAK